MYFTTLPSAPGLTPLTSRCAPLVVLVVATRTTGRPPKSLNRRSRGIGRRGRGAWGFAEYSDGPPSNAEPPEKDLDGTVVGELADDDSLGTAERAREPTRRHETPPR